MKVALLLSGQPRYVNQCFPLIKQNIIDQADTDIFCHVWKPNDAIVSKFATSEIDPKWVGYQPASADLEAVRTLYKPKAYVEMDQIDFISDIGIGDSINRYYQGFKDASPEYKKAYAKVMVRNSLSMFAGIKAAHDIYKNYTKMAGEKYDFIARTRYDLIPTRPIDFNSLPVDIAYEEMGHPDGMISDWLNIGHPINMVELCHTYDTWYDHVKAELLYRNAWCNELLIKRRLVVYGVKSTPCHWGLSIVRP